MSEATQEARILTNDARALIGGARAGYALTEPESILCSAVGQLADAVALLAHDADATQRVLASRTEHLA